jgi:hypothetical protein
MHKLFRVGVGLALGSIVALGGCVVEPTGAYYGGYYTSGYAPYGERYVTPDGYTVVYDSGPGAYTVAGVPGLYWWGGYYYRRHGDYWERSHHYRGPWVYRSAESVPFVAHRGGYGHSSGGVRAQATDSAPGRYGNRGWAANQAGTVQRYDQFPAAQNQRYQQRSTTYPSWDAARRAQNQNRNLPGRYPPGFVPPDVTKGQARQQPDWRPMRTQDVPGGGTSSPDRGAVRRGWTGSAQNPPRQQPAWGHQELQNQHRYRPGQVPPNAASGKAQHAPRGQRPQCPPGKRCERESGAQR